MVAAKKVLLFQELAKVITTAKLTAPELRRWLQMLEDQGRDDATQTPLPGLRGAEAPDVLLAQAFVSQRMERYQGPLHELGYQSAVDLQALMEEADNFNEEELASVAKALDLKPPEIRRLQAMEEVPTPHNPLMHSARIVRMGLTGLLTGTV
eukprot:COSAG03_NODE_1653_length_3713_cov_2129.447980_4_plen_152_part_00